MPVTPVKDKAVRTSGDPIARAKVVKRVTGEVSVADRYLANDDQMPTGLPTGGLGAGVFGAQASLFAESPPHGIEIPPLPKRTKALDHANGHNSNGDNNQHISPKFFSAMTFRSIAIRPWMFFQTVWTFIRYREARSLTKTKTDRQNEAITYYTAQIERFQRLGLHAYAGATAREAGIAAKSANFADGPEANKKVRAKHAFSFFDISHQEFMKAGLPGEAARSRLLKLAVSRAFVNKGSLEAQLESKGITIPSDRRGLADDILNSYLTMNAAEIFKDYGDAKDVGHVPWRLILTYFKNANLQDLVRQILQQVGKQALMIKEQEEPKTEIEIHEGLVYKWITSRLDANILDILTDDRKESNSEREKMVKDFVKTQTARAIEAIKKRLEDPVFRFDYVQNTGGRAFVKARGIDAALSDFFDLNPIGMRALTSGIDPEETLPEINANQINLTLITSTIIKRFGSSAVSGHYIDRLERLIIPLIEDPRYAGFYKNGRISAMGIDAAIEEIRSGIKYVPVDRPEQASFIPNAKDRIDTSDDFALTTGRTQSLAVQNILNAGAIWPDWNSLDETGRSRALLKIGRIIMNAEKKGLAIVSLVNDDLGNPNNRTWQVNRSMLAEITRTVRDAMDVEDILSRDHPEFKNAGDIERDHTIVAVLGVIKDRRLASNRSIDEHLPPEIIDKAYQLYLDPNKEVTGDVEIPITEENEGGTDKVATIDEDGEFTITTDNEGSTEEVNFSAIDDPSSN